MDVLSLSNQHHLQQNHLTMQTPSSTKSSPPFWIPNLYMTLSFPCFQSWNDHSHWSAHIQISTKYTNFEPECTYWKKKLQNIFESFKFEGRNCDLWSVVLTFKRWKMLKLYPSCLQQHMSSKHFTKVGFWQS
jgi:hypothetical protein